MKQKGLVIITINNIYIWLKQHLKLQFMLFFFFQEIIPKYSIYKFVIAILSTLFSYRNKLHSIS